MKMHHIVVLLNEVKDVPGKVLNYQGQKLKNVGIGPGRISVEIIYQIYSKKIGNNS
jgi:hypothetical protein